jgi:hypothetical protein
VKIPQLKELHIHWGLPLTKKVYREVGVIMTEILPYVYQIQHADDEGAVIYVLVGEDQEKEIKELRETLIYVDVWFEEENHDEIKKRRLLRWAESKRVRKSD